MEMRELSGGAAMDSLWSYCQEGRFTDIRIVCKGGVLSAHKAILCMAMPVLKLVDTDLVLMPNTSVKYLEQELKKLYENQPAFSAIDNQKEPVKDEQVSKIDNIVTNVVKVEMTNEVSDDEDDMEDSYEGLDENPIYNLKQEDVKGLDSQSSKRARGRIPNENKGICEMCQKKFSSYKCLLNHLSRDHNILLKCKHCPEQFVNYEKLRHHKQEVHKNLLKYHCAKCDRG